MQGAKTDVVQFGGQEPKHIGRVLLSEDIEDQYEAGYTGNQTDIVD